MMARRVLFLDSERLTAFLCRRGSVEREGTFAADGAGLAAFADYVAARRNSLFHILAEVAEEGFEHEDIPWVRGRDRIAVIKRKLAQYDYGTPLAVALSAGRRKTGRRDEAMLFAALTQPRHFEPWLEILRQGEAPLVGVFSLPQLAPLLLTGSRPPAPCCLLITLTCGGLRQTYIEHGQLRFSRLTVPATGTAEETAAACAAEAAKIHQYLAGKQLLGHDGPLPVHLLVHPAQAGAFRLHCRDTRDLRFDTLDLLAEAGRLGLRTHLADSCSEALFAHLLVHRPPARQFAPSRERHFHRLGQLRQAVLGTGLAICAGGLLFAVQQSVARNDLAERSEILRRQAAADERRYQAVLQSLPPIPGTIENLRALVSRYEELQKRAVGPEPLYRRIGIALQDFPSIELDRLNWTVVNRVEDAFVGGDRVTAVPSADAGPYAVADIHGQLPMAMAADHRGQLEALHGFADRLRGLPGMQVRILSLPFDAESGKALKSGGSAAADVPRFALRVAQNL
ncbi:MAG: hypothetical protein OEL88_08355 [Sterolibacteriaceae bacterium MAG5]|nr:hypothetical protein [Candidatus Nitricoxidireducens bremensis]